MIRHTVANLKFTGSRRFGQSGDASQYRLKSFPAGGQAQTCTPTSAAFLTDRAQRPRSYKTDPCYRLLMLARLKARLGPQGRGR